jgi:DNA polymerase-3 subunit alpha
MLANVQKLLDFNREIKNIQTKANNSLFGAASINLSRPTLRMESTSAVDMKQKLLWEKELLGLYVSAHPFAQSLPLVKDVITPSDQLRGRRDNSWVAVAGVITGVRQIRTRKNEPMCFVTLEDLKSVFEVLVFPSVLEKTKDLWQKDKILIIGGRLSFKDGEPKVLANKAEIVAMENMEGIKKNFAVRAETGWGGEPDVASSPSSRAPSHNDFFKGNLVIKNDGLYISVPSKMKKDQVDTMKDILQKHPGDTQVFLVVNGEKDKIIQTSYLVDASYFR